MADHRETLRRIAAREPLRAWSADATDLPWGDPEFSERMLREHLDQSHREAPARIRGLRARSTPAPASSHIADATHLDLLFTDMVMPGMSGRELAAQLAATHPTARTVYASGYSNDALLYGVGTDGKSPYLAKPFTADGLLTKVREVLDSPD